MHPSIDSSETLPTRRGPSGNGSGYIVSKYQLDVQIIELLTKVIYLYLSFYIKVVHLRYNENEWSTIRNIPGKRYQLCTYQEAFNKYFHK